SAGVGRAQSVYHGGIHLPAATRLQSDGNAGRARLLVGGQDQVELFEQPRSAGAGLRYIRRLTIMRLGFIGFIVLAAVSSASALAADANHGKELFLACAACHTEKADALGPSLKGIVGRKAASLDNFRYSPAMQRSNITWTEANLRDYLMDPQGKVKGNRMPFSGIPNRADVDDLI